MQEEEAEVEQIWWQSEGTNAEVAVKNEGTSGIFKINGEAKKTQCIVTETRQSK